MAIPNSRAASNSGATFNMNATPGDIQTDMSGMESFNPGMLQNMLNWKMGMAEEMQKAKLAEMRQQMRLAQEMNRARQNQSQSQSAPLPSYGGGRNNKSTEERAREEYFKAAMSSSGSGLPGYDKYRRELMLKTLLGGGSGGGFSASPEAAADAALKAQGGGESPASRGFNEGMNTLERTKGTGSMSSYTPMDPGNRYTPGDVTVPSYYKGPGTGRKTGGHIPEDGWYYLHEDEDVTPSPKTLRDLMVGRLSAPDKNPGPGGGYETGTSGGRDSIMDLILSQIMKPERSPEEQATQEESQLEALYATQPQLERPMPFDEEFSVPEGPTSPEMGTSRGDMIVQDAERRRQMVANPDVHPEEAAAHMRGERSRIAQGSSTQGRTSGTPGYLGIEGASVEEMPLSERRQTSSFKGQPLYNRSEAPEGQTSVKKYTIDQTPGSESEADERKTQEDEKRAQFEDQEIERLSEAANSHAAYASELLQYAGQNYGSPVYEAIREMAAGRLQLGQQMERAAAQRSKQRDARKAAMAESQARVVAADIEARGRMGAASATAEGNMNEAAQKRQTDIMNNLRGLAQSFAGIEDADPEAQEALLREFMQAFIMLGGMQEAFGGGLPNGG